MIRKRRLELGLRQREVAAELGCDEMTVVNWEKGRSTPRINHMGKIVQFLGYNPLQEGHSMAERLVSFRSARGRTQRAFAVELGVDPSTLAKWERGERTPTGAFLRRVELAIRR
jgi:transcriptional regulator with XRE-family HTH domain